MVLLSSLTWPLPYESLVVLITVPRINYFLITDKHSHGGRATCVLVPPDTFKNRDEAFADPRRQVYHLPEVVAVSDF